MKTYYDRQTKALLKVNEKESNKFKKSLAKGFIFCLIVYITIHLSLT